ncbi:MULTISPECIES: inorganic pyrophosphatase [Caproicibacterium]|uniref:Inorganic pyrophosphatase n=1 Tax=Caproicibacterium lactatifermentans TaxID=2666138 RepID=A0A859DSQ1_9FIRM|nr:inorganic pyrophosphatase [Caproicibacterium lactatifermentans]ARP49771.1 inorganic pyrophosphatase [Ruminococcaceae bacterium CPB6]MDD4807778.1 inorganic pyrophosphatase [Oscillospiraceae bacterium]QKN24499.1 inorganic pyrophosphatase [Caproicibacterium lactatifermentans]QKO30488.1 inorganic pyrophosphatase [Caproicibacterium lactatifermentans]
MKTDADFWNAVNTLLAESEIVVDRPKGSVHPHWPDFVYPADYGYLKGTASMDGSGIDVWIGSELHRQADAILCTIDLLKRDSEIKILIGCTEAEKSLIVNAQNQSSNMKAILVRRTV